MRAPLRSVTNVWNGVPNRSEKTVAWKELVTTAAASRTRPRNSEGPAP